MIYTHDKASLISALRGIQLHAGAETIHHTATNTIYRFPPVSEMKRVWSTELRHWAYAPISLDQATRDRDCRIQKYIHAIEKAPAYLYETNRRTRKGNAPQLATKAA